MNFTIKLLLLMLLCFSAFACTSDESEEKIGADFKFGMVLVGPKDDKGWSQAHYEGGQYIEQQSGGEMIVADLINPADSPNLTVDQVVSEPT